MRVLMMSRMSARHGRNDAAAAQRAGAPFHPPLEPADHPSAAIWRDPVVSAASSSQRRSRQRRPRIAPACADNAAAIAKSSNDGPQ
jgi:hypothetical protein